MYVQFRGFLIPVLYTVIYIYIYTDNSNQNVRKNLLVLEMKPLII